MNELFKIYLIRHRYKKDSLATKRTSETLKKRRLPGEPLIGCMLKVTSREWLAYGWLVH